MYKDSKTFGFIAGVVFTIMFLGVFLTPLFGLISAKQEVRMLAAEAATLKQEDSKNQQTIRAQADLLDAYRAQTAAVAEILGQAAETLENIAFGSYSREQIQAKVARVAEIIIEVNQLLDPEEVDEISQAIVLSAVAADIDPLLLTAMAITESYCQPGIRGRSGEYGMMQIMPGTGRWIAEKLGYKDWEPADMMDIRMNVEFSAYYLRVVTREFRGDTVKGVLAYNRGSTGARKWLAKHKPEEHSYVRKVMGIYQNLREGGLCGYISVLMP